MQIKIAKGFENVELGFSDKKLESLLNVKPREKGLALWIAWEPESTGFGKTFRKT